MQQAALKLAEIRSGYCPFCREVKRRRQDGLPLRLIAQHVRMKHAISARTFKDSLGLTFRTSLASLNLSKRLKELRGRDSSAGAPLEARLKGAKAEKMLSKARRAQLVKQAKLMGKYPVDVYARNKKAAATKSRRAALVFKHGTRRGYEHWKCRCVLCKKHNTDRQARYRNLNRAFFNLMRRRRAFRKRQAEAKL